MRRIHLAVFVLMLGLVVLYTWPLASDPAHLLPDNPDPRTLAWVVLTVFRNVHAQPDALLHGNAFYPFGQSLTFTEPLLTPAVVAGPLLALTGNAVLAYNVTLLLFWAFSGWAMYAVAFWLTRDHVAALIAAAIFTLSSYRTEMYNEFQMQITFGIPLGVYTLVRFLESQRVRDLALFGLVFWLQSIAVLYYAVILAFGLAVVALQYVALRWDGWRARTLVLAAGGAGAFGLAAVPVLWPFLVTRQELGFERSLDEVEARSAEVLTYVEMRSNWLYRATGGGYAFETSLFLGCVGLGLAAIALFWLRRERPGGPERALSIAIVGTAALGALVLARGLGVPTRALSFSAIGVTLLALLLARQGLEGWRRRWQALGDRRLGERDWVLLLIGLALAAFLLSLGPVVRLAGRPMGAGLYAWLYPYLLPLRAIRAATRIGVLVVFAGALLAAFGVTWLRAHLPRTAYAVVIGALGLLLGLEYATFPLAYGRVPSVERPVDVAIRAAPADTVVLEWPTNVPGTDADAMLRSVVHGKRVVNGYAGFVPALIGELSDLLTRPGPPFPEPAAEAALRRIYPLDLIVVRLQNPTTTPEWRARWWELRRAPPAFLRFRGTYGDDDLWEVIARPERGREIERWVSFDFLRGHPVLRTTLSPLTADPGLQQSAEVLLNGQVVAQARIDEGRPIAATLRPPYRRAAPNVIGLRYVCHRAASTLDERYRIGATGIANWGELHVRSAGQPYGNVASIAVNCVERASNRRGYNLVALRPDGRLHAAEVFDTFFDPTAAARLAAFVGGLPDGTVVAGAVRDEASGRLTKEAVTALRTLGVVVDLRGRFRESHAFVGVKGARAGSALEASGPRAVTLTVGRTSGANGFELESFVLARATQ